MIVLNKSFEELNEKAMTRLQEAGFNTSPGSIARLFYGLINEDLVEAYNTLNVYHVQHLLSTAEGEYVDHIGSLLNCTRLLEESDADYKYRISQQTLSLEKANETSIRLAILSVEGIQDVVLKPYSHGPGTFSALLIIDPTVSNKETVSYLVRLALLDVVAYGTKYYLYEPIPKELKMKIKLYTESMSSSDLIDLNFLLTNLLKQTLNGMKIGEEFNSQDITQVILNSDKRIRRFSMLSFCINNKEHNFKIQSCRWNERYVLSSEPDALTLS